MRNDMSLARVIEFFSCFTKLPIRIQDVCDQVTEQLKLAGFKKEIVFRPMNVSPDVLLGMTLEFKELVDGAHTGGSCFVVFYNENITPQEQRVICCKELVHLYDNGETVTKTAGDLAELVDDVVAMPVSDGPGIGMQGLADKIAIFYALAILFPDEMRGDIKDLLDDQDIDHGAIASIFDIPIYYVKFLLSQEWYSVRNVLIKRRTENNA